MGKGNDPNCAVLLDAPDSAAMSAVSEVTEPNLPMGWNSDELNYFYIDSDKQLRKAVKDLRHPKVTRVGLDIETTGGLKPWHGSTRLIQIAVELPEPKQFLIDLWHVDPHPVFGVIEDPRVEIDTCNGIYEQVHLHYRFGLVLTNLYDLCYASQTITKSKQEATRERAKEYVKRAKRPYNDRLAELRRDLRAAEKADDRSLAQRIRKEIGNVERERDAAEVRAKEDAPRPRNISNNFRLIMRRYTGKKISKEQQTSAWDAPNLNESQLRYAAMDVAGLLDARRPLGADVAERGLQNEVARVNAEVLDRALRALRGADPMLHQAARLARAMQHSESVQELERFYTRRNRLTLHHSSRQQLDSIYQNRLMRLVEQSRV